MAHTTEDKQIQEVEKQEIVEGDAERTRVGRAFVPQVDIYETDDELIAVAERVVSTHRLSKSRFLAGLQCHKRLYLEIHSPELATPPTPDRRAIMDMGTNVGVLAR